MDPFTGPASQFVVSIQVQISKIRLPKEKSMNFRKRSLPVKQISIWESIFVITGICVFAVFIHKDSWWQIISFAALVFAGLIISWSVKDFPSLLRVLGIIPLNWKVLPYILAGLLFGIALGLLYNVIYEDSLLPSPLTGFIFLAPLIGFTEELVYRGFVQGNIASTGALLSIVTGSIGHTLYKYILLRTHPFELDINFTAFVLLTFSVGIVLGILRHYSRSILPPAVAHGIFDMLVYGGAAAAPVWVWG